MPKTHSRDYMCCRDKSHRPEWKVTQRNCNFSAFNGYHYTRSDYSRVRCFVCGSTWRTKAKFVDTLPDAPADWSREGITKVKIRSESCSACPYRRDVPSGVWSAQDYDKLPEYDGETFKQPPGAFMCHATTEVYCHGWAVVHGRQPHDREPLAFRFNGIDPEDIPPEGVPLFSSGAEAAEHGKRDILNPSDEARAVAQRLMGKYDRLKY